LMDGSRPSGVATIVGLLSSTGEMPTIHV